jgi:hypothetical protein
MQRIILHPTATGLAQRQTALCAATMARDLRINGLKIDRTQCPFIRSRAT